MLRTTMALAVLISTFAHAQSDFSSVAITSAEAAPGIHVLYGAGGNIGLAFGEDAVFLVDDQFAPLSDKILAKVEELAGSGVDFVLNTHYHFDHTGGNEALGEAGALVIGHDNIRDRIVEDNDAPGDAPVLTFRDRQTFHINGLTIRAVHVPHAHTDGDSFVLFEGANVIHTGDLVFHASSGTFPYIDLDGGGSIQGMIDAVTTIIEHADAQTVIIPGHGSVLMSKADAQDYLAMLTEMRDTIGAMIKDGQSLHEVVAAKPADAYKQGRADGFIKPDVFVETVYKSLVTE
ncbi:MAG: MBL fold metallo-hydrolase [Pseudomonadota bacterium]